MRSFVFIVTELTFNGRITFCYCQALIINLYDEMSKFED